MRQSFASYEEWAENIERRAARVRAMNDRWLVFRLEATRAFRRLTLRVAVTLLVAAGAGLAWLGYEAARASWK